MPRRSVYGILSLVCLASVSDARRVHRTAAWRQDSSEVHNANFQPSSRDQRSGYASARGMRDPRHALSQLLLARIPKIPIRRSSRRGPLAIQRRLATDHGPYRMSSSLDSQQSQYACRSYAALRSGPCRMKTAGDDDFDKVALVITAAVVGAVTGIVVSLFKLSIASVTSATYTGDQDAFVRALIPAAGGLAVAIIRYFSSRETIGPGLAEHVTEVQKSVPFRPEASLARGAASVATLGTGNSMGPEGPSVELGVAVSRFIGGFERSLLFDSSRQQPTAFDLRQQRQLIAAGAAAGVAAGFNAPLAGVFFTLEVVDDALRSAVGPDNTTGVEGDNVDADRAELDVKSKEAISATAISALVAAVVVQELLGKELALQVPDVQNVRSPLSEIPLSVGLGALAGGVAILFESATAQSRELFRRIGSKNVAEASPRAASESLVAADVLEKLPSQLRPVIGGLACGIIGLAFPQILFFGYSTLDSLIAMGASPSAADALGAAPPEFAGGVLMNAYDSELNKDIDLIVLLAAKLLTTAICIGSGLVGGTFAPSIFLGAVLGVAYQSAAGAALGSISDAIANYQTSIGVPVGSWGVIPQLTVADSPAYAMIGAAATLASVFRAPLTATLLVFELSRKYDLILPLLAAAGTGPLVAEQIKMRSRQRDKDSIEDCDIDYKINCDAEGEEE